MTSPIPTQLSITCPGCGREDGAGLERREESHSVRGVPINVERIFRKCLHCDTEFEHSHDPDWRRQAFRIYRDKMGMLQPDSIREWRTSLCLTQQELSALLGWGSATLGRYEKGSLQSEAHDRQLRALMEPATLFRHVKDAQDLISVETRQSIMSSLRSQAVEDALRSALQAAVSDPEPSIMNGYRRATESRIATVFIALAGGGEFKTKLNKLLFYADFWHFQKHDKSLTGLHYARAPHGPVPNDYEPIIASLVECGVLRIEEVDFPNGHSGEKIVAMERGSEDALDVQEQETIDKVRRFFRDWTATRIRDESHKEDAWLQVENGELISYEFAKTVRLKPS